MIAALSVATALAPQPLCASALDCELLGRCVSGRCVCSPGFTGPTCGQLDLGPVPKRTHGRVWPVRFEEHNHTAIGWSFSPAYDPRTGRYVAAVEAVCDRWGSDVWIAAVSANSPVGPFRFDRRLGPAGTNCPHLKRLRNGTFTLVFDALASGVYPPNATKDPTAPVCVGGAVGTNASMAPALPPCGAEQSPSQGHHCICSRASRHCPAVHSGVYVASTERWPDGPWRIAPLSISGAGWSPYNATLFSIGTSNPSLQPLADGRTLLSFRSHRGYWPAIEARLPLTYGSGEHTGFALGPSIEGPFAVSGNLSWQYGNDEDGTVWQQPDGSLHCLYHNGRGKHPNRGLHAFSTDGRTWHKPHDALQPACASAQTHNCSAMYTDTVELDDGSWLSLAGRERPAILFDDRGPAYLYNGAIDRNVSLPWYAMVQPVRR